jgi:beta-N-acetylhexosaminidase
MLDLEGLVLAPDEIPLLLHPMVGGVILFARNADNRQQITDLAHAIREIRQDLLLAVDQEGGRVQRFREGYTRLPPMAVLGRFFQEDEKRGAELLKDCGWLLAAEVIASGMDFSFTPVLDVDDHHCEVIGNRSFHADPALAAAAARHFITGLHEAGMAVTGKHFPGHGGVAADSHLETPRDRRTLAALQARDLVPFKELSKELDAVMPAHIQFPEVDQHCVGFSSMWLQQILRQQMGFDGVIFSDDLSMKGADVAGGYPSKAKAALDAGCDMILVCNNRDGVLQTLKYLEEYPVEPSYRLPAMKARRTWNWSELEQDQRRFETINALNELV